MSLFFGSGLGCLRFALRARFFSLYIPVRVDKFGGGAFLLLLGVHATFYVKSFSLVGFCVVNSIVTRS